MNKNKKIPGLNGKITIFCGPFCQTYSNDERLAPLKYAVSIIRFENRFKYLSSDEAPALTLWDIRCSEVARGNLNSTMSSQLCRL